MCHQGLHLPSINRSNCSLVGYLGQWIGNTHHRHGLGHGPIAEQFHAVHMATGTSCITFGDTGDFGKRIVLQGDTSFDDAPGVIAVEGDRN